MGHGHDRVVGSGALGGGAGPHEYGVRRKRAFGADAQALRLRHGRADDLQFLGAEQAAFTGMRIQPRHRQARLLDAPAAQGFMGDLQRLQHGLEGHGLDGLPQRLVDGDQHHAQFVVGQHHAHRRRRLARRRRQRLQHLGVAGEADAGSRQRLLVDGRGDDGAGLAGLHPAHRGLDAQRRSRTAQRIDAPQRQRRQPFGQSRRGQHGKAARRHVGPIGGRFEQRQHRPAARAAGGGAPQHRRIANDDRIGHLAAAEGLDDDLGADAGGIAHGHEQGLHGTHFMPGCRSR